MAKPIISIITISYNIVDEIERTIASIKSQKFTDFEWIVVDGQSSDGTAEIFKKNDKLIAKLISPAPAGPYDAMNKGAELATGELICFLNGGDEFYDKDALQHVWLAYLEDKDSDLFYGDTDVISEDGTSKSTNYPKLSKRFLLKSMINHQAIFCKLSSFNVVGPFDITYRICSDYDWLLRALYSKGMVAKKIDTTIAKFHLGGMSSYVDVFSEREVIQKGYYSTVYIRVNKLQRSMRNTCNGFIIVLGMVFRGEFSAIMTKVKKKVKVGVK